MSRPPEERFSEEPTRPIDKRFSDEPARPPAEPRAGWERDEWRSEPVPDIAQPGGEGSGLGSLAQDARLKQLNVARWCLIIVGLIYTGVEIFELVTLRQMVEAEVRKQGMVIVNQAEFERGLSILRLIVIAAIGIGVTFIILGLLVHTHPLGITIAGLVLFIAYNVVLMLLDKHNIYRGIILKVIVVVALVKAIQAAAALERDKKTWTPGYE